MKNKTIKKKTIPILISALCVIHSTQLMASQENDYTVSKEDQMSVGVGAMSGALIAGPVGFVVGGLVGALFSHDIPDETSVVAELNEVDELNTETTHITAHSDEPVAVNTIDTGESNKVDELLVASASNDVFVIEHEKPEQGKPEQGKTNQKKPEASNKLKEIITDSLNIVVYFTPGSVTTESFYEEQFVTVLDLMQEIPEIELNLAGYSDRRGTDAENVQLASQRIASIRDYFVQHGIEEHRIKTHAYGEKNLLSTYGELDSYMFDRRVVLSFNVTTDGAQENVVVVEPVASAELTHTSPF